MYIQAVFVPVRVTISLFGKEKEEVGNLNLLLDEKNQTEKDKLKTAEKSFVFILFS